jgi:hypothetical protein
MIFSDIEMVFDPWNCKYVHSNIWTYMYMNVYICMHVDIHDHSYKSFHEFNLISIFVTYHRVYVHAYILSDIDNLLECDGIDGI